MSVGATQRLSRLLAMVPWLLQRQGVPLEEAARHFGITERPAGQGPRAALRLRHARAPARRPDRGRLGVRPGLPGQRRRDQPPAAARGRRGRRPAGRPAHAGRGAGAARPRRGRVGAGQAVRRRGGRGRARPARCTVDLARGAQEQALAAARDALRRHRRLHLRYLVPSRDETTERDVDPMRLLAVAGPLVPRGLVPPGRGRAAVPARPGRRRRGARRRRHAAARGGVPGRGRGPVHAVAGRPRGHPRPRPARALGRRLLPGRGTSRSAPDGGLRVRLRTANPDWVPRLRAAPRRRRAGRHAGRRRGPARASRPRRRWRCTTTPDVPRHVLADAPDGPERCGAAGRARADCRERRDVARVTAFSTVVGTPCRATACPGMPGWPRGNQGCSSDRSALPKFSQAPGDRRRRRRAPARTGGASTMTTIKASCPSCGDVELTPQQVRLVVCSVKSWSYYAFTCTAVPGRGAQARGPRRRRAADLRRRRRRAVGRPRRGARGARRAPRSATTTSSTSRCGSSRPTSSPPRPQAPVPPARAGRRPRPAA